MVGFEFVWSYNCVEREREALLRLKEGFKIDNSDRFRSWGSDKKECCKWEGIRCDNTAGGHVTSLVLNLLFSRGYISPALLELHHLKNLDLSGSDFERNRIPRFIFSMKQLQHLNLGWSNFSGTIPSQISNLTNLQALYLPGNSFFVDNLSWLNPHLPFLSQIDFRDVHINDPNWLQHVLNLPSLQKINLKNCGLTDAIKPSLYIPAASSLRELDLSRNKLKWLPSSIWQLHKLEKLDVSFNSLADTISEDNLTNLQNLKYLDLSFNSLILRLSPNWTPPFRLEFINFRGCDIGPHFPLWFRTQSNLGSIDLSLTGLKDEVPKWFWDLSVELDYLNLSHNHLSGIISHFSPRSSGILDVSFNKFSGPIPAFGSSFLFQLSQNMFSGSISSICTFPSPFLSLIDLSNNQLVGELPNCWKNIPRLQILNLANNRFSDGIPHSLGSNLFLLKTLQLGNNNLSGELPSTLKNCENLQLIDVGGNMFTGNIPSWLGAAYNEKMACLIFRNNRFEGGIPPQICSLTQIRVLDLSGNHLSGKIPPCFYNFTLLVQMNSTISPLAYVYGFTGHDGEYVYSATVSWKGQYLQYRRSLSLLKIIDLSSNRLVGDIPRSFSSLRGLISLNLSRNSLTGIIHPDIGEMKMLEVLDLSINQLSGAIPNGMAQLNFLAVLDFANNNLSGKIPIGGQLHTFNASSYAGNHAGLCGSPLLLCPREGSDPSINNKVGGILSFPFLKGLVLSIILGFIFGFWGVVGSLIVKESWRRAYFYFWDAVGNWLYVTTAIFWAKLIR